MRQVLGPVLVGRSDELRVLLDALDGVVAGRGATTLVRGEAGSGKSRLVRELSGAADDRGLPALTGGPPSGSSAWPRSARRRATAAVGWPGPWPPAAPPPS